MTICPHCNHDLEYHDYYGKFTGRGLSGIDKAGEIFKCGNEQCDAFDLHFHTDRAGDLREGYPC